MRFAKCGNDALEIWSREKWRDLIIRFKSSSLWLQRSEYWGKEQSDQEEAGDEVMSEKSYGLSLDKRDQIRKYVTYSQ